MTVTDLLTTRQVQDFLRVDRTTIYRMVESGQLPAIRVGKQWRFARSEVEVWLQGSRSLPAAAALDTSSRNVGPQSQPDVSPSHLTEMLPLECAELIQDAFAEMLGVTMIITDMQGQPVTQVSNPCEFFKLLIGSEAGAIQHCVVTWQQMAHSPALEPRFAVNEMGLLCARGLIRMGAELKGMVVIGGIAPENWPPSEAQLAGLSAKFGVSLAEISACVESVFRLDRTAQERSLRNVQRIADIFSHILEDRSQMIGRLQVLSALVAGQQLSLA